MAQWKMKGAPSATPDNSSLTPDSFMATQTPGAGTPAALTPDSFMAQQSSQPSVWQVLSQPTDKTDQEFMRYRGAAGVAGATVKGLNDVARGTEGALEGLYNTVRHPIDTARSIASIPSQAAQVPAAIRDINASPDPLTHYADAAQDTASQGAGQALTALATAGVGKVATEAAPYVGPVGKALVKGYVKKLIPSEASEAYKAVQTAKANAPGPPTYPGAPLPENPGEFPGAPLPEKPPGEVLQAQPIAVGAQATPPSPASALGKIPAPWRMKPQADALGEVPTPATQPAAQTGEALSQVPIAPWRMKPQAAALGDTPASSAAPVTARQFTNKVGPMIDEGLGNPPTIKPAVNQGQPIYRRTAASAPEAEVSAPAPGMPEGSVPVEGSKAVKSYHYDEPSQTMSVELNEGTMHRYAPVSPDQAQDFANAPSKGRAWLDLKNQPGTGHVAANYGNGWINKVSRAAGSDVQAAPVETPTTSSGDLTGPLEDSVAAVKKAKWKMKAAP
jgi:hypothetical protein